MTIFLIFIGILLIVVSIFLLPIAIKALKTMSQDPQLLANGQQAFFKIVSVEETSARINYKPVFKFLLEVYPANGSDAYKLEKRLIVPLLHISRIQPGSILAGKYDPRNPDRIAFDFAHAFTTNDNSLFQSLSRNASNLNFKEVIAGASSGITIFVVFLVGFILSLTAGILLLVWGFILHFAK